MTDQERLSEQEPFSKPSPQGYLEALSEIRKLEDERDSLARQLTEAERRADKNFDYGMRYREALEAIRNLPNKHALMLNAEVRALYEIARRALDTGDSPESPPKDSGAALNPGGSEDLGPIQEPIMHERARRSWLRSQAKRAAENRAGGSEESG